MTILVLVGTIHSLLDPDKYALPWRSYCALSVPLPSNLDALSEVGVFVGVMSVATEAGFRRREMIRSTWAAKGRGRERTVVKFVVGQTNGEGEKELEMENQGAQSFQFIHLTGVDDKDNSIWRYHPTSDRGEYERRQNLCVFLLGFRPCSRPCSAV